MNYGNSKSFNFLYNCLLFSTQRWLLNPVKISMLVLPDTKISSEFAVNKKYITLILQYLKQLLKAFIFHPITRLYILSLLNSWILPYVACKIFTSFWEHGSLNHCGLRNKDLQERPYFARRTQKLLGNAVRSPCLAKLPQKCTPGSCALQSHQHPHRPVLHWCCVSTAEGGAVAKAGEMRVSSKLRLVTGKQGWPYCLGGISRSMDKKRSPPLTLLTMFYFNIYCDTLIKLRASWQRGIISRVAPIVCLVTTGFKSHLRGEAILLPIYLGVFIWGYIIPQGVSSPACNTLRYSIPEMPEHFMV